MKIHSSCKIEDFVETHLCKLCVILRSRVIRVVCPHIYCEDSVLLGFGVLYYLGFSSTRSISTISTGACRCNDADRNRRDGDFDCPCVPASLKASLCDLSLPLSYVYLSLDLGATGGLLVPHAPALPPRSRTSTAPFSCCSPRYGQCCCKIGSREKGRNGRRQTGEDGKKMRRDY